jgi:hypothetical protein
MRFVSIFIKTYCNHGKKIFNNRRKKVGKVMKEFKEGKLKSSSGDKVKDRKQAIAIGISEAREAGLKVPKKKPAAKKVNEVKFTEAIYLFRLWY